ncbi:MAG: LPS-assembly protein LptD, partial [Cyclobacteriaceae bacterium]|nr:LPS-assembly protein LptD [Cyclobacteriaceae bacterium]
MLKLKHLFIFPYLFFVVGLNVSFSQNENTLTQYDSLLNDIPSDSSAYSLDGTDSLSIDADSLEQQKIGDIETTIQYMAEDSIHMDVPNQIINLYGEAQIIYGDIELTASHIEINYLTHLITAKGTTDSLGNEIGKPVFKDGDENFETDNMKYNFESRKAIIDGVVTQQGEAVMQGEKVFKNSRDELFISQAKYTTCNLADPHFHIQSSQLKVIPNSKVVSGPFYIKIRDIPTPLGFAFGMFPVPKQKVSGILFPGYGEEKRRGFYLKNGGYYFAISDYIDLSLTGEIYSKGSWGLNAATSYNKRYSYTGRFNARYNNQKGLSEGDSTVINDLWVNWSHSPQSKGT